MSPAYVIADLADRTCFLIRSLARIERAVERGDSRADLIDLIRAISTEYDHLPREEA